MTKRTRTPQEKKELSYARDGRNTSAEGRRKAHTSITRRKVKANRALRHAEARALAAATEPDADVFVARRGRRSWKKIPDAPLGEYVSLRLESREIGEMNAGDRRSPTLNAGRKRARFRNFGVMGGFYRGQNKMLCRAVAEERAQAEKLRATAAEGAKAAAGAHGGR
jgi:hypothetical protein